MPISRDWTTGAPPTATAGELAHLVAGLDPLALGPWHHELARVVHELHEAARSPLAWSVEDPVAALVRALARLARRSPDVASPAGASLAAILGPQRR